MNIDLEVGEIIYITEFKSLFRYIGRDKDGRVSFKLFFASKRHGYITNHVSYPERHLTDPAYGVELIRVRHLEYGITARMLIKEIMKGK